MDQSEDYLLAMALSKIENESENKILSKKEKFTSNKSIQNYSKANNVPDYLNQTANIINPEWETIDPTPDIFTMFATFDNKFFQCKLQCVQVEWSKKMYSCAGICYQRKNRLGMSCIIRLSEPLLKLRPRKDLVQTLLHEMIHAYCFVLGIREGNGGHGPHFLKIMHGINKVAGTTITVYHSFHDEVDLYKTHVWRCNGICQHRRPFFGYVKRTSNRAPGPNDFWWRLHQESCGGYFKKIQEPEKKQKTAKNGTKSNVKNNQPSIKSFTTGTMNNKGSGTLLVKPTTKSRIKTSTTSTDPNQSKGNLKNVVGFKDIHDTNDLVPKRTTVTFSGTGQTLNNQPTQARESFKENVTETVRNIWSKRFTNVTNKVSDKRRKLSDNTYKPIKIESTDWQQIDEDVFVSTDKTEIINLTDSDSDNEITPIENIDIKPSISKQTSQERQSIIKQEIMDSDPDHDDEIELIDDEFEDGFDNSSIELADTSLIEDLFGDDSLMNDFNKTNKIIKNNNVEHEIISCPICQMKMSRNQLEDHIEGCLGIQINVEPIRPKHQIKQQNNRPSTSRGASASQAKILPFHKNPNYEPPELDSATIENMLRGCGYSSSDIEKAISSSDDNNPQNTIYIDGNERESTETTKYPCPVCSTLIEHDQMNTHLDNCLN